MCVCVCIYNTYTYIYVCVYIYNTYIYIYMLHCTAAGSYFPTCVAHSVTSVAPDSLGLY